MPSVLIVGGSIAGLASGLMLARAGHQVTVLERDAAAVPRNVEDAASWMRPTVPQVQHAHGFGALSRAILARRLPDVLDDLLAVGAGEYHLRQWMPPTAAGAETITVERTDDLISLGCRRTTFDWVLRQRALGQPDLMLRDGVLVTGLVWRSGSIPHVIGVATRENGTIPADVVLDASGRRTACRGWAGAAGVEVEEWDEHCGFTGYTRFYRILNPAVMPKMARGNASVLIGDGFLGAAFLADNGTVAVVLGRLPQDATLQALQFPDVFDAAAAALPPLAPWVDPDLTVAISPVTVIGGIRNTIRFPLTHGRPRLLGLHSVGDALAVTNPAYGRGASLAIAQAEIVVDGLAAEPDSPLRQAELIGHRLTELALPHWRDTVRHDRARVNLWRANFGLRPLVAPQPTAVPMPVAFAAAAVDAEVWVRLFRVIQVFDPPQAVFDDPALAARIAELGLPPLPAPARREALLAAIDTHRMRAAASPGAAARV
ncbi:MAG: FAD-dependent monooxygenase [Actinomycetota bacterium]|nr:FAD-dependent monooxygenase [Actinomycetota bacterium]